MKEVNEVDEEIDVGPGNNEVIDDNSIMISSTNTSLKRR